MDMRTQIFDDILKEDNYFIISIVSKAQNHCCLETLPRINNILKYILNEDKKNLQKECYLGLPDELPCLRALIWKINFKYLPLNIKQWEKSLYLKRHEYIEIKKAFLLKISEEIKIFEEIEEREKNGNLNEKDDLLILSKNTDRYLLETINKDINRTRIGFQFFLQPVRKTNLTENDLTEMIKRKKNCAYNNFKEVYLKGREKENLIINENHSDVIERILYIYSKLNKDVGYVQGMNEIVAPIYYCYSCDNMGFINKLNKEECIEADTFWSFSILMDDIKNLFLSKKDKEKDGMFGVIDNFNKIIKICDYDLYKLFLKNNINLIQVCFKWFNLFFSQEFKMPDILRLWDSFFCENNRLFFVYCFGVGVLKYKKKKLMSKNDMYEIIQELGKIETNDVEEIIDIAINIKKKYQNKILDLIKKK